MPPAKPPPQLDFNELVRRIRVGDNPMGAAYRLCALTRPATITELVVNLHMHGVYPREELLGKVTDGWLQWRDAGKPPAVQV